MTRLEEVRVSSQEMAGRTRIYFLKGSQKSFFKVKHGEYGSLRHIYFEAVEEKYICL